MKQQKKKKTFNNADWFSLAGFIAYYLLTFLGFSLKFNLSMSFIFTSLLTGVIWGLLALLKKLKRVNEDIKSWRPLEYLLLGITLLGLIFLGNLPMDWALSTTVVDNSSLKEAAMEDVTKMEKLFDDYETQERDDIAKTRNILMQYYRYTNNTDFTDCIKSHFGKETGLTEEEIYGYISTIRKDLLPDSNGETYATNLEGDYQMFKNREEKTLRKISQAIDEFNFYQVPQLAMSISSLSIEENGKDISKFLTGKSKKRNEAGKPFKFTSTGEALEHDYEFQSEFKAKVDNMLGFSYRLIPMLLSIIVNIVMLLSYFMTYRSAKVEITRKSNKRPLLGGIRIID